MDVGRILVIHVMKTAGTSLRKMLEERLCMDAVYPSSRDLAETRRGWYPGPAALLERDRDGRARGARVLVGHIPYVLSEHLEPRPFVTAVLREPVARTVSILEHRRRRTPSRRDQTYRELLEDEMLVELQIRDYQTKMFAFDSLDECSRTVHVPLEMHGARFERALARLQATDLVGLTEDFPTFARALGRTTGLAPLSPQESNRGGYETANLEPEVLARIHELTTLDRQLYTRARELAPRDRFPRGRQALELLTKRVTGS